MRGKGGLTLIGALVLLGGYTTMWWGYAQTQGGGLGFLDLLLPSRLAKASSWSPPSGQPAYVAPGSTRSPNGSITPTNPKTNLGVDPNTGVIGAQPGTASPGPIPPGSGGPAGGLIPPGLFGSG